ncbi:MAG: MerR family transcriptional regulator [Planctomycetota bacterium]
MPKLDEYLRIKEAADYLGVARSTLRNWDAAGKIPVHRHPMSNYRLFKKEDLQEVLRQIEESGTYPTEWRPPARSKRKPR